ncbi:MAG: hypothetical protein MJ237_08655 [bacterium]|nr:hypothetical protein [bacterium]
MVSIEQVKCKLVITNYLEQVKKYLEYHRKYKVILELIDENNNSMQDEFTVIDIEHFVESEDELQQYQFEIEIADNEFSYYSPEDDDELLDYLYKEYGYNEMLDAEFIIGE